jgi:hypothetical protein
MRTIETLATVAPDGTLTAHIPTDIAPGEHRIVIVVEEPPEPRARTPKPPLDLRTSAWGSFPAGCTFRREDIYGDDGR